MTVTALRFIAVLLCCAAESYAAKYFLPKETEELFRVEKIPLQVDSMKKISKHLTVLAQREQDDSPAQTRATAQLLTLAIRLDPANQDAREINRAMHQNTTITPLPESRIDRAITKLHHYQPWLSNPNAGIDANTLATYITDATRVFKEETKNNPDQADWSGVLPPLTKYVIEKTITPAELTPTQPKEIAHTNESKPTPPANPYRVNSLTIHMPLTMDKVTKSKDPQNGQERWTRTSSELLSPITVTLKPKDGPISFSPKIDNAGELNKTLEPLKSRLNSTPNNGGVVAEISMAPSLQYPGSNGSSATAAIQLMLEGSKAGNAFREDIYLCAALTQTGTLRLPKNFWRVLPVLREDNGRTGRLIVPNFAAEPLIELLVLEEPEFFTRWEVIGVNSTQEAISFCSVDSPSNIQKAEDLFLTVRKSTDRNAVTKLAVNSAVRTRLGEILALNPNHLSAKILLLQGSGKRPLRLSELGTAYQIQTTVAYMREAASKIDVNSLNAENIKSIHERARTELDPHEKFINHADDELYKNAIDLANDLRSLALLAKRNQRQNSNVNSTRARKLSLEVQDEVIKLETKIEQIISSTNKK